jgi:hypothetical protein
MQNRLDTLRGVLAGLLGSVAAGAVFVLLGRRGLIPLPAGTLMAGRMPHGPELVAWLLTLGLLLALAALYGSWFDGLLAGPAPVRGLKFGALAWMWFTTLAAIAFHYGAFELRTARPWSFGLATLATSLAYGIVVGTVYGAGRRYGEYTSGMGYGLPDRRSLA